MTSVDDTYEALRKTPIKEILLKPWQRDGWSCPPADSEIINWWLNTMVFSGSDQWLSAEFINWGIVGWTVFEFNNIVLDPQFVKTGRI